MKTKLVAAGLIIICFFVIFSCGKTGRDAYANFDRIDDLFSRVKDDSIYKAFYELTRVNSGIMISNSKKSGKADTAILNSKDLSLDEKYKRLNYADYNTIESNTMKQSLLITVLISKYPEFKTLSEAESKKLVMLSNKYYRKQVKQ
ncbi:MAG: hypothetical protein KTQ13_04135 [Ferruginibacter sp.]|nr:hypothetical protein [Ferruginibacter sp.]MBU9935817.1 hypothetical protein [Ferruginibacter sp.]HQY10924.1 hypothetical protein [Ferruginibacter sp.]